MHMRNLTWVLFFFFFFFFNGLLLARPVNSLQEMIISFNSFLIWFIAAARNPNKICHAIRDFLQWKLLIIFKSNLRCSVTPSWHQRETKAKKLKVKEFPCEIVAAKTQTKRIAAKQINKRVRLMCTSITGLQFKFIQNRLNPESGKRK